MEIVYALLGIMIGLLGWIGNKMSGTLEKIQNDISDIRVLIQKVSTAHDDLKERVEKVERKIYNLNNHQ